MKPFTFMTLLGIRPDIIRMHKLISLLDNGQQTHGYSHVFAHTGQHFDYELDGIMYEQLHVRPPDINLAIGRELRERSGDTGYATQLALLFERVHALIERVRPDAVIYLGDTNSVVSSMIVARQGIPVVHIEAGGRSYDWRMPEEKCRITIDHLSDVLYCYLDRYRDILLHEGIAPHRIRVVGNIIYDAIDSVTQNLTDIRVTEQLGIHDERFALVTLHREENTSTSEVLEPLLQGVARFARDMRVVFPIMPRVARVIREHGFQKLLDDAGVIQTPPQGFMEFLKLEQQASMIITDSGTVQEEACILGVPCLVARRSTERPETIQCGATILSATEIYERAHQALRLPRTWDRSILNPSGKSPSQSIFDDLMQRLQDGYFEHSRDWNYGVPHAFTLQAFDRLHADQRVVS